MSTHTPGSSPWRHVVRVLPFTEDLSEVVGYESDAEFGPRREVFRANVSTREYTRAVRRINRSGLSLQEKSQRFFDSVSLIARAAIALAEGERVQ